MASAGSNSSKSNGGDPADRELVWNFLRRREEKAFRTLYRRHTPMLHQFVLRLMRGNPNDAGDVLQTTWIRAIENLARFRWESSLRSWLTGIALNCSREVLRQRGRTEPETEWEVPDSPTGSRLTQYVNRVDLERAIAALPNGYREVLILHDIEGYTHQEIGSLLGIESGTSKSQLSRARGAIRARMAEGGGLQP